MFTPRSRVLLEKPTVAELLKGFPDLDGFNTGLTGPYPESDESSPHSPTLFISSSPILMLFIYL
jgi:hypothetical protein